MEEKCFNWLTIILIEEKYFVVTCGQYLSLDPEVLEHDIDCAVLSRSSWQESLLFSTLFKWVARAFIAFNIA